MSNYTFNLQVTGGDITATESHLTADSVEYIVAAFSFDESWDELIKTAVFRVGEIVYHTPLEEDKCYIPFEALQDGMMYISVFGVLGDTRATTAELPVTVQNSGYAPCEPSAPSPDPYNYFLEKVTELKASAQDSAERAEADSNSAADSLKKVVEYEANALEYSQSAVAASNAATAAAESAENSAKTASDSASSALSSSQSAVNAAEKATSAVMGEIENHNAENNSLAHPNIVALANEAKAIALGKANSLCFDTEQQLKSWVAGEYSRADGKNVSDLKVGDNLYIIELGVPDYWWDGSGIQPLGAEKPDLSDYYTKDQLDGTLAGSSFATVSRTEYDADYAAGNLDAGRIYFVYEEE